MTLDRFYRKNLALSSETTFPDCTITLVSDTGHELRHVCEVKSKYVRTGAVIPSLRYDHSG